MLEKRVKTQVKKKRIEAIRDRSKIRGGRGLVQTWGGPWFFMQAQKGGLNNLVYVIKSGPLSFMQRSWGQGVNLQFLGSHSHSSVKYNMEHILYLMTVEYKHGFLMTLLGLMSRSSPDSNKQYIVKIECKLYLFND